MEAASLAGVPALDAAIKDAAGGLSATAILAECSRVLHALARKKGGEDIADMAALEGERFDQVFSLFERAAAVAHKASSFSIIDIAAYGALCDRLRRVLVALGLERRARDVGPSLGGLMRLAASTPAEPSDDEPSAGDDEQQEQQGEAAGELESVEAITLPPDQNTE